MKPEKIEKIEKIERIFDTLSTDEMGALIEALTAEHKERLNRDKRRRKAEEYAARIYDLISEALYDGFNVMIDSTVLNQNCDVEVYD